MHWEGEVHGCIHQDQAARGGGAFALVVVVIALFGAIGAASANATTYTALGDSYAAGPLIPNQSLNPLGCLRSDHNYAHLTAAAKALTLTDVSCSGATTNDMTESQNVEPGPNPPQFNGLSAEHQHRLGDDRRQRHRVHRNHRELHHLQPVLDPVQEPVRLRRPRPAGRTDRKRGAEGGGGAPGHPRPLAERARLRRQLPGDPADRQRLLADDAARLTATCRTCSDRGTAQLDAGDGGRAQRRDDRQLVRGERRSRRLQVELGRAGSNR